MSVITKVFVVLLVILSLVTSAGLIVFVSQMENYRQTVKEKTDAEASARAENATLATAAIASAADTVAVRKERDSLAAQLATATSKPDELNRQLSVQVAALTRDQTLAQVERNNLSKALQSSEDQRQGLKDVVTATRKSYDDLLAKSSDDTGTISRLTSELEQANFKVREFGEQITQLQTENQQYIAVITAHPEWLAKNNVNTAPGAPPRINGVVDTVKDDNGIPHATISVGTDDDVKVGMRFYVIDRTKPGEAGFLGFLTIEAVDVRQATGRLSGPNVSGVQKGVEVRTQL